jgi:hypothetical protein
MTDLDDLLTQIPMDQLAGQLSVDEAGGLGGLVGPGKR